MKNDKSKIIIILLVAIIILLLVFIGLMLGGKVSFHDTKDDNVEIVEKEEISYDVNDYVSLEKVIFGERANVEKVVFKNLDEKLINEFLTRQDNLINQSKKSYDYNKSNNFSMIDSSVDKVSYTDIWYQINNKILTVYYMIVNEESVGSCPVLLTVNIDLENKRVISDEELLNKVGVSFDDIALENYNKTLDFAKKHCNDEFCGVQDKEYKIVSIDEYVRNKESYINLIKVGLDDVIFAYVKNGKVEYSYSSYSIDNLYLGVGKGGCFNYLTVEVGNLK